MKWKICSLFYLLATLTYILPLGSQSPAEKLSIFQEQYPQEKVYCSLDKPYYLSSDRIWGATYLVDATYHQFLPEGIVHVELISPEAEIIGSLSLKANGKPLPFHFDLDPSYGSGNFIIRAYTQYQKNFPLEFIYQQEIPIVSSTEIPERIPGSKLMMEFYPEGGYLVYGLSSKVGFIAKDETGKAFNIKGRIFDNENVDVVEFKSWKEGMGSFQLTPEPDRRYMAEVFYNDSLYTFELPKSLDKGSVLSASTVRKNEIFIEARSNQAKGLEGYRIVVASRGVVQVDRVIDESDNMQMLVDKATLPAGLLNITLFDKSARPIAERLVFNHKIEASPVSLNLPEKDYLTEELAELSLDTQGIGYGSLSIYMRSIFEGEFRSPSILSHLLLSSDLDRNSFDFSAYVHDNTTRNRGLLDAILLTYGWRRYDWLVIMENEGIDLTFPVESSISVSGQVLNKSGKRGEEADVIVSAIEEDNIIVEPLVTDETGIFYIDGFQFEDTTDIIIQASKHSRRSARKNGGDEFERRGDMDVLINLFDLVSFDVDTTKSNEMLYVPRSQWLEDRDSSDEITISDEELLLLNLDDSWSIDLEEITVSASRMNRGQLRDAEVKRRYEDKDLFYFASTDKYLTEDAYLDQFEINTVFDLIQRVVPGTRRALFEGQSTIVVGPYSAPAAPTIAVDGVIMDVNQLYLVDPNNIALVDVITEMRAEAVYGSSYVLSLITFNKGEAKLRPAKGTMIFTHPGFFKSTSFSSFLQTREDFLPPSTTIHWEPSIDLAQAHDFTFNTGKLPGIYRVKLEGLMENGDPFYVYKDIVIEAK